MKIEKIKEIEKEFSKIEEKFCMEEIINFDQNKIIELIKNFIKNEKIPKFIVDKLQLDVEKYKDKIKNIEHLNIILVGPSGVGKSTLISEVLNVETNIGFGKPTTQNIEYFSSEKFPFIRLADSRGIEKNKGSGALETCESIKNFIKEQLRTKDPDKYIHCIWYCWTGSRLENIEVEVLKELNKQYSLETLPIIIVYTKAIDSEEVEKAKNYIKDELKLNNCFIEVLAKEKKLKNQTKIEPFNIDLLREETIKYAKSAVKSSIYEGLIEDIKNKMQEDFTILNKNLKDNINIEVHKYLSNMNINSKIEDFYKQTKNIILNVLYKYFIFSPEVKIERIEDPKIKFKDTDFSFTETSIFILDEFITNYFKKCFISYDKNLNEFLTKYAKELTNDILIFQFQYNQNNEGLLSNVLTKKELEIMNKQYIIEKLNIKINLAVLKNSFNFITIPIIDKIGEFFTGLYKSGLKHKNFLDKVNSIIKISFDEIENKIKKCNEDLKKEEKKEIGKENLKNQGAAPNNVGSVESLTADMMNEIY